jgi:periplasmic divalent cation tolerance protein
MWPSPRHDRLGSPIVSLSRLQRSLEQETEVPLIMKTREEFFDRVSEWVKILHPYETPSIIGIGVDRVNQDYLDWIYAETSSTPVE